MPSGHGTTQILMVLMMTYFRVKKTGFWVRSPRPKTIWAKDASAQTMGTLYETSAIYNAMVCYKKVQVSAKQRSSDLPLRKQPAVANKEQ